MNENDKNNKKQWKKNIIKLIKKTKIFLLEIKGIISKGTISEKTSGKVNLYLKEIEENLKENPYKNEVINIDVGNSLLSLYDLLLDILHVMFPKIQMSNLHHAIIHL